MQLVPHEDSDMWWLSLSENRDDVTVHMTKKRLISTHRKTTRTQDYTAWAFTASNDGTWQVGFGHRNGCMRIRQSGQFGSLDLASRREHRQQTEDRREAGFEPASCVRRTIIESKASNSTSVRPD